MIYRSNNTEHLCNKLAENTVINNFSPFDREIIITQSAGMTSWVKTELARRNGIIANTAFMNQDSLMSEIWQFLTGEKLKNSRDFVRFRVYELLGSEEFKTEFPEVAAYYKDNDLRRIQLSAKTSDLIDQYQLYRPEMISLWDEGNYLNENPAEAEKWQQWLWKRTGIKSRKTIRDKMYEEMDKNSDAVRQKFPRISLFGITIFTEFHLEFFRELSRFTVVDIYLCLPTDSSEFTNELLASFGNKAMELSGLVSGVFNNPEPFEKIAGKADSSLARLQNHILDDKNGNQYSDDGSIQISSCYTPGREVECLYNYLLDLFVKDKTLKPGDILVIATDIDKYAPLVKAVFRNAPVKFPFRVSGAAKNSEDSIVSAIEMIMRFTEEDLTSEKVMSILEQYRIRKRYSISDTDYIRSVVKNANIRFGHRNSGDDDTVFVSWEYGLEKILLGYAMLTDKEFPARDNTMLYPYRDAEASASHDLLKLKAFVEKLHWITDQKGKRRSMTEWKKFILEVIDSMVWHDDFDKDDRADYSAVYKSLNYIDDIECSEAVPFEVFLNELDSKLFRDSREMHLNTGNITVSAPIPVRGIPFKVICFLGLDNGTFPARNNYMGFDLLGESYKEGDRNKKETDKYLFLDTILSARQKLWISYIGQSVKNNREIPPSIVLDILTDYLGIENIIVKHPLHGFSPAYQINDNRLFTYLYNDSETISETGENDNKNNLNLSVQSFISFFEHPVKWYFRNILKIDYYVDEVILPENELFTLDYLQRWILKNDLIKTINDDLPSFTMKAMKNGSLPLKNAGKVIIEEMAEEIENLKGTFRKLINERPEENIYIDLVIRGYPVRGIINSVYEDEFIAWTFSDNIKHWITAWLKILLLSASGKITRAVFIDKYGYETRIGVPDAEDAKMKLELIMRFLEKGSQSPLIFSLKAAEKVVKDGAAPNDIITIFSKEAEGNSYMKIEADPYMKILLDEGYYNSIEEDHVKEIETLAGLLNITNN